MYRIFLDYNHLVLTIDSGPQTQFTRLPSNPTVCALEGIW